MASHLQLDYAAPSQRYRQAARIMLLVMGIVNACFAFLTALAGIALYVLKPALIAPGSIDFPRFLIAGSVNSPETLAAGGLYVWCSFSVHRGSRAATRLARTTALLMTLSYTLLLLMDPILLAVHRIQIDSLAQFVVTIVIRLLFITANAILAWLLSRRLAEMQ